MKNKIHRQASLNLDKGKVDESQRRKAKGAKAINRYASQLPKDGEGVCLFF
jgi:hypothetical protein